MAEMKRLYEEQLAANMDIFNQVRSVPNEAKKTITGGRLNGMTDIKPMWRIQRLTEVFGMCGIGWKTTIKNKEIIEGANNEKIAIVDIDLFLKLPNGEWTEAIEGTGGSSFVSNEKNGLYTSDECFKMAYTDALSVACKSLGMGADVYWGDSKYNSNKPITKEEAENYILNFGKHSGKKLTELDNSYLHWLYENNEQCKQMIDILGILKTDEEIEETLNYIPRIMELIDTTGVDLEKIKNKYKIDSLNNASLDQLKEIEQTLQKHKSIQEKVK